MSDGNRKQWLEEDVLRLSGREKEANQGDSPSRGEYNAVGRLRWLGPNEKNLSSDH